eukprot:1161735-Pelagomonas_calceolata.AAC.1
MGLHKVFPGAAGLNILSLGYAQMYALLELHICLSILWLLDTYFIAIPASMELYMNVAWHLFMLQLSCPCRQSCLGKDDLASSRPAVRQEGSCVLLACLLSHANLTECARAFIKISCGGKSQMSKLFQGLGVDQREASIRSEEIIANLQTRLKVDVQSPILVHSIYTKYRLRHVR